MNGQQAYEYTPGATEYEVVVGEEIEIEVREAEVAVENEAVAVDEEEVLADDGKIDEDRDGLVKDDQDNDDAESQEEDRTMSAENPFSTATQDDLSMPDADVAAMQDVLGEVASHQLLPPRLTGSPASEKPAVIVDLAADIHARYEAQSLPTGNSSTNAIDLSSPEGIWDNIVVSRPRSENPPFEDPPKRKRGRPRLKHDDLGETALAEPSLDDEKQQRSADSVQPDGEQSPSDSKVQMGRGHRKRQKPSRYAKETPDSALPCKKVQFASLMKQLKKLRAAGSKTAQGEFDALKAQFDQLGYAPADPEAGPNWEQTIFTRGLISKSDFLNMPVVHSVEQSASALSPSASISADPKVSKLQVESFAAQPTRPRAVRESEQAASPWHTESNPVLEVCRDQVIANNEFNCNGAVSQPVSNYGFHASERPISKFGNDVQAQLSKDSLVLVCHECGAFTQSWKLNAAGNTICIVCDKVPTPQMTRNTTASLNGDTPAFSVLPFVNNPRMLASPHDRTAAPSSRQLPLPQPRVEPSFQQHHSVGMPKGSYNLHPVVPSTTSHSENLKNTSVAPYVDAPRQMFPPSPQLPPDVNTSRYSGLLGVDYSTGAPLPPGTDRRQSMLAHSGGVQNTPNPDPYVDPSYHNHMVKATQDAAYAWHYNQYIANAQAKAAADWQAKTNQQCNDSVAEATMSNPGPPHVKQALQIQQQFQGPLGQQEMQANMVTHNNMWFPNVTMNPQLRGTTGSSQPFAPNLLHQMPPDPPTETYIGRCDVPGAGGQPAQYAQHRIPVQQYQEHASDGMANRPQTVQNQQYQQGQNRSGHSGHGIALPATTPRPMRFLDPASAERSANNRPLW